MDIVTTVVPSATSPQTNTTLSPEDTDDILQRLSDERALQLLPVLTVFAFVFILGLVGNSLTVYIYGTKFKATWSRTAIVALGTFDLMSCIFAIPGEVVDLRFSFNYYSDVMCRLSRACATFPSVASGLMLTAVAFDRYRLICTPLKTTASRKSARLHVLVVCGLSLLVTWPAAVIYGAMSIETGVPGVTGRECSTSDDVKFTKIPLAYNLVLAFVFISSFVAMIVFYTLIGRQIYRQGEFRKTLLHMRDRKRKNTQSELEASLASDPDAGRDLSHGDSSEQSHHHYNNNPSVEQRARAKNDTAIANGKWDSHHSSSPTTPNCSVSPHAPTSPHSPTGQHSFHFPPTPRRKLSRTPSLLQRLRKTSSTNESTANSRTRKTTVMLCLISVVFVLSFLPHLAVKLVRTRDKGFLTDASTGRLIAYNLCARSYFLNSFVNVFIYGFCSLRFRRECVKVVRKLLLWKCCRRICCCRCRR